MSPKFFYLKHFIFILHHIVLIVRNTMLHTLICVFDEIIFKMIIVLHANQKTFSLPPKIRSSNLERKLRGLNYFALGY